MLVAAIRDLVWGTPAFEPRTSWHPLAAIAAALVIIVAGVAVATLVTSASGLGRIGAPAGGGPDAAAHLNDGYAWAAAAWLLTFQWVTVGLVLATAALRTRGSAQALFLDKAPSLPLLLAAIVLMVAILLPYNAIVLAFAREQVVSDLKSFLGPLRSSAAAPFALAIVAGAPLSEELLFRGFLLAPLSKMRLKFFGGALVTTVAWTALHAGYSSLGLIEVFIAGLFFSWLLWRTGNLWVPIICHAVYNGLMLALIYLVPLG